MDNDPARCDSRDQHISGTDVFNKFFFSSNTKHKESMRAGDRCLMLNEAPKARYQVHLSAGLLTINVTTIYIQQGGGAEISRPTRLGTRSIVALLHCIM